MYFGSICIDAHCTVTALFMSRLQPSALRHEAGTFRSQGSTGTYLPSTIVHSTGYCTSCCICLCAQITNPPSLITSCHLIPPSFLSTFQTIPPRQEAVTISWGCWFPSRHIPRTKYRFGNDQHPPARRFPTWPFIVPCIQYSSLYGLQVHQWPVLYCALLCCAVLCIAVQCRHNPDALLAHVAVVALVCTCNSSFKLCISHDLLTTLHLCSTGSCC